MTDNPSDIFEHARDLAEDEQLEEAAKQYARAGHLFARQSRFAMATGAFSESSDKYTLLDMRTLARSYLVLAANCAISVDLPLTAFEMRWVLSEMDRSNLDLKAVGAGGKLLGEIVDPNTENFEEVDKTLQALTSATTPATERPYVSAEASQRFYDFFREMPAVTDEEVQSTLYRIFLRVRHLNVHDVVGNAYTRAALAVREIQPQWREVLATFAYTRAAVAYAKTGQYEQANIVFERLSRVWGVLSPIFGEADFYQYQYDFFSEMEAALKGNFHEADRFYVFKMSAYTRILRLRGSNLQYLYRLWGWTGGASLLRASVSALAVPAIIFPIIYVLLWVPLERMICPETLYKLVEAEYLSFLTFVTLGFGDVSPEGWTKVVVSIEAVAGYLVFGLLLAVIVRKMFRS